MRAILVAALGLVAGCGRAAPPEVVVADPVAAAEDLSRPLTLADTGRRNVKLTGDPADPTFAGRKFSEWRADLRVNPPKPGPGGFPTRVVGRRTYRALKAMECYGPHAAVAVDDILAVPDAVDTEKGLWRAIGGRAAVPLADRIGAIKTDDETRAWNSLWALGPAAGPALPKLLALADRPEPSARQWYPGALVMLGPAARPAAPQMLKLLGDPDKRRAAAVVLAKSDPTAVEAIPHLIPSVREAKGNLGFPRGTIQNYGPRLARVLADTALGADRERLERRDLLPMFSRAYLGDHAAAVVPDLIRFARAHPSDDGGAVLEQVADLVSADGPARAAARPLVPELIALAAGPDDRPSYQAIRVLGVFGADAAPAAEHVARHVHFLGVPGAVAALERLGPGGKAGVPALMRHAADPSKNADTRALALVVAARFGADPAAVTTIAHDLSGRRDHPDARAHAAAALLRVGPGGAARADEVLRELAASGAPAGRPLRTLALAPELGTNPAGVGLLVRAAEAELVQSPWRASIRGFPAVGAAWLREHLDHRDGRVAAWVATQLFLLEPTGPGAAALLERAAGKSAPALAQALRDALPGSAPRALEALRVTRRYEVARMLADVAADGAVPADALAEAVRWDRPDGASYAAVVALGRCGERARPHLNLIRDATRSPNHSVAVAAAQVLAELDPSDRTAVPLLRQLASDPGTANVPSEGFVLRPPPPPPSDYDGPDAPPAGYPPHQPPARYSVPELAAATLFAVDPEAAVLSGWFDQLRGR